MKQIPVSRNWCVYSLLSVARFCGVDSGCNLESQYIRRHVLQKLQWLYDWEVNLVISITDGSLYLPHTRLGTIGYLVRYKCLAYLGVCGD